MKEEEKIFLPKSLGQNTPEKLGVTIEFAAEKDWEEYKKIRCEAIDTDIGVFGEHFKEEAPIERGRTDLEWQEDLRDSIIVLAKSGSKTIGVVKGIKSPNEDEQGVWRINSVYLNPNFRRSATGENTAEKMIQMLLEEEKKRGAIKSRLWVLSARDPAVKLYEKLGFKKLDYDEALEVMGDPKYLSEYQIMDLDFVKNIEELAQEIINDDKE